MAESMRDKVAIVGVGCCQFGENWTQSAEDMIVDAAFEAYQDAGIDNPQRQIDAVFCGALYPSRGTAEVAEALKLFDLPITLVQNYCATGTDAFRCAAMSIAAGLYDTVLVVGFDKPKDRGVSGPSVAFNVSRGLPMTPAGWFSLCAARYFETFNVGRLELAKIAVKNHHNGTLAPKSMLKKIITTDDVLNARMISWPFGLYDCAAQSDGASVLVLSRADRAGTYPKTPVWLKGVAVTLGRNPQSDPDFDFLGWGPTRVAAAEAYRQAGIDDPLRQINLAQVHDCFTLTELLTYEDLGFCARGQAKEMIDSQVFHLGGQLPVNTDGGLKSFGHPTGATGVRMLYENTLQLRGEAGPRQVPRATTALSHNIGGAPQACGVVILGVD